MNRRKRDLLREEYDVGDGVVQILSSLQKCELKDNLHVLNTALSRIHNIGISNHLKGARAILELLLAEVPYKDRHVTQSFLHFDHALNVFYSYSPGVTIQSINSSDYRKIMKDFLCHIDYGIKIYIIDTKYVLLKKDDGLERLFSHIYSHEEIRITRLEINKETVKTLISSMTTEWDKNVLRAVLTSSRSVNEVQTLGISHEKLDEKSENVLKIALEKQKRLVAAEDIVLKSLETKQKRLQQFISEKNKLYNVKQLEWSDEKLNELLQSIQDTEKRKDELISFLQLYQTEKSQKNRFKRMVERAGKKLIEEERLGKRKHSSGRKRLMDEEDERYLLKCIEEKCSAHGRRGDEVMYSSHRIKKKHFLAIINSYHHKRNLPLIKSATAVLNRAKPARKRSRQAKLHIGLGLFCARKPPKSGDTDNDLTHYQRAHKKLIVHSLYGNNSLVPYIFEISMDDKAYLVPGTSTGMTGVRNVQMFQPTDAGTARKLPKYDFPTTMVCITPATNRVMTKELVDKDGKKCASITDNACYVFLRPKYFVGSSPSVWTSEFMKLRHMHPFKFELQPVMDVSLQHLKRFCLMLHDMFVYFIDSSDIHDVKRITKNMECVHAQYYLCRLLVVENTVRAALDLVDLHWDDMPDEDQQNASKIKEKLKEINEYIFSVKEMIGVENGRVIWEGEVDKLLPLIQGALEMLMISENNMKSIFCEWTDAGPGVGITQYAVKYRAAQIIRIFNLDYYVRLHLANDDSSHNEVERVQSYVGDAIADGGAINWEHKKLLDEYSPDDLLKMPLEKFQELEVERMKYNAIKVAEDISSRIDGATAPGGYFSAYPSQMSEDNFFSDAEFLTTYINKKSTAAKESCAGSGYYSKLSKFMDDHFLVGLKYVEYIKFSCRVDSSTAACSFCTKHPLKVEEFDRPPTPVPDISRYPNLHYLSLTETLNVTKPVVDQYNPRVNITTQFESGQLKLGDSEAVKQFSKSYAIEEKHINSRLGHLELLKINKKKKSQKKTQYCDLPFEEIDWRKHYEQNTLKSLKVSVLNKYLESKKLQKHMHLKKKEKLLIINHSISFELIGQALRKNPESDEDGEEPEGEEQIPQHETNDEAEDEEDEVLDIIGMTVDNFEDGENEDDKNRDNLDSDLDDNNDDEDVFDDFPLPGDDSEDDVSDIFTVTKSGRVANNWKTSWYR